jgi:hypothetical protein
MLLGPKKHELAERIGAALDAKRHAEHGPRFILPWRMDANQDHETKEYISCSTGECGCGISPDVK